MTFDVCRKKLPGWYEWRLVLRGYTTSEPAQLNIKECSAQGMLSYTTSKPAQLNIKD